MARKAMRSERPAHHETSRHPAPATVEAHAVDRSLVDFLSRSTPGNWALQPQLPVEILQPRTILGLQRAVGNQAVQRVLSRPIPRERAASINQPTGTGGQLPIQRVVMTDKQWQKESSVVGKPRSAALLRIDQALATYNVMQGEDLDVRTHVLERLSDSISAWIEFKKAKRKPGKKFAREDAVTELLRRTEMERLKLVAEARSATVDKTSAAGIRQKASQIYRKAEKQIRRVLATVSHKEAMIQAATFLQIVQEARNLTQDVMLVSGGKDDDKSNAQLLAQATNQAVIALSLIARGHQTKSGASVDNEVSEINALRQKLARVDATKATIGADDQQFSLILADVRNFQSMVGAEQTDAKTIDSPLADEGLNALDLMTTVSGYLGTGGKGNEGLNEFYKPAPDPSQPNAGTPSSLFGFAKANDDEKKDVREFVEKFEPTTAAHQDILSGSSDMGNAAGGLTGASLAIYNAIQTIRNPNASAEEKRNSAFELSKQPFAAIQNVLKFTGGALTAHRGDMGNASQTGTLAGSNFGFSKDLGADVSTDVKMAGDFAGVFTGSIDSIKKVVDLVSFIDSAPDAKAGQNTVRKNFESIGNLLAKFIDTVSSIAGNFASVTKLAYQIADHGQITHQAAAVGLSTLGDVTPALSLIKGIIEALRNGYKLVRIGIRRSILTDKLNAVSETAELDELRAIEFSHESLVKRTVRIGINLGHAMAAIGAGIAHLSGIGSAPGMAISIGQSAMKLGQIATRVAKQRLRDRKGKKRAKKGKTQTYEEWERAKRLKAVSSGSKWERFKAEVAIAFTFNWDKTSDNKEETNRKVAMEILRMNDPDIFKALGVKEKLAAEGKKSDSNYKARFDIVLAALKKRD